MALLFLLKENAHMYFKVNIVTVGIRYWAITIFQDVIYMTIGFASWKLCPYLHTVNIEPRHMQDLNQHEYFMLYGVLA